MSKAELAEKELELLTVPYSPKKELGIRLEALYEEVAIGRTRAEIYTSSSICEVGNLWPQVEDQGGADQTEAQARCDQFSQHRGGKAARTTRDRRLAKRRVRGDTCVTSARDNTSRSKML